MTSPQPQEYIITEEQLHRLEKNGVSYVSNNIANEVRSHPSPATPDIDIFRGDALQQHDAAIRKEAYEQGKKDAKKERRTYESCHRHFACPDGEECWYASEDYYWDVGGGARRLTDEWMKGRKYEQDRVLNELLAKFMLDNKKGNWRPWNIQHIQSEIEEYRESLRTRTTQEEQ